MGARPGEGSREARKKVTAVFADMAGSTALAEQLDPEAFRRVVQMFFERLAGAIEHHGGSVENFVGDEVAGVFGATVTHGDDAVRAVRAAAEMMRELETLNDELEPRLGVRLQMRVGVNTGTVIVGAPIAGRAMALGDAMNVAARLEKRAAPGQILIGAETHELVRREIQAEPAGELELRGRHEPIAAYRLVSATAAPELETPADGPLVGRGRDLALLNVAFERCAARGSPEFVTVLGEAGVGKSRLVAELVERYRPRATLLVGRCLSYGEGITYWPLAEIVEQAVGIEDGDEASLARSKLDAALSGDPDGTTIARHLAQIIGLEDGFESGEHGFWTVRRLLEKTAVERPLIVVLEDLQWAEPALLDLVEHLGSRMRDAPVLLACTARFELLDRRPEWRQACRTVIALEPLAASDSAALIDSLVGSGLADPVRERLVDLAAGNPLFVEQVLSMLVDEGELRRTEAGWAAAADLDSLRVPPTMDAILAARIDHLGPAERAFAECAAVIGKDFWARTVAELTGRPLQESLDPLARKQLVERVRRSGAADDLHRFRHLLVRDAVYESIPKARRAELHERVADWLAERSETRLAQVEEILAYHLESAYRYRRELLSDDEHAAELASRAAKHLIAAGRRAAMRQDDVAAASLLTRAVALLAEGGASSRLEPLVELGMALIRGGDTARAEEVLADARRTIVGAGDQRAEARMRVLELHLKRLIDPSWWAEHGRAAATQVLTVFQGLGDDLDTAKAWHLLGKVHSDRGEQAAAAEALEHALELAQSAGDTGVEAWIRYWLLQTAVFGPTPCERVIARARDDLAWAHAHNNRALEGSTLGRMGEMLARAGHAAEAHDAFDNARRLFDDLGLPVHIAYLAISTTAVEPLASHPEAAERELRSALSFFERIGAKHIQASVLPMLAATLVAQGRLQEALALTERAHALTAPDDLDGQIKLHTARARALAIGGERVEAERLAREAVNRAAASDTVLLHADALTCLAEVLERAEAPSEAVPVTERALALYEAKGDLVSAGQRRATLRRLSEARAS
ncbi:MAG TPA: AAA family ATPase [Solirubrobacterales bacterium]|nr:AAA family ATPase [Solirubrobacterales bacterium]